MTTLRSAGLLLLVGLTGCFGHGGLGLGGFARSVAATASVVEATAEVAGAVSEAVAEHKRAEAEARRAAEGESPCADH